MEIKSLESEIKVVCIAFFHYFLSVPLPSFPFPVHCPSAYIHQMPSDLPTFTHLACDSPSPSGPFLSHLLACSDSSC